MDLIAVFVVSIAIAVARGNSIPQCQEVQGLCACLTDQGLVDLSPLDSKDPSKPTFSDIPDPDGTYQYSFNPCTGFTEGQCTDVALCQVDTGGSGEYPVGDQDTITWNSAESLVLSYTSVDWNYFTRISAVKLECSKGTTGTLIFEGEEGTPPVYTFTLKSKHCCPGGGGGGGGLSTGSVLCIVFVCLSTVYVVSGVLYNMVGKGASGHELLPNAEFWTDSPALVKDGCCFVFGCCRGSSYENMG